MCQSGGRITLNLNPKFASNLVAAIIGAFFLDKLKPWPYSGEKGSKVD